MSSDQQPSIAGIVGIFFGCFAGLAVLCSVLECLSRTKEENEVAPPATNPIHTLDVNALRLLLQLAPPTTNVVQVWEANACTVEGFLQEIAKDKPIRFTSQQLRTFTNDYSVRLGSGGFGDVYKGHFPNGVKIAVKLLKRTLDKTTEEQFMSEVGTIGRTYHKNLVKLFGFCYDKLTTGLVYEYLENGSLDKYLAHKDTEITVEWEKLHKIAVGAAKGIAYLHHESPQMIIHYDIKPGNVLLDAEFSPKVADFGLAKLCNSDQTHMTVSGYRGTPGYSAPEFMFRNFPITYKCDVYSFGILLFEIVGGRNTTNMGSADSLDWFPKHVWKEFEKGSLATITTSRGVEEKDIVNVERMCKVALWCVQDSPDARPPMSAVMKMLDGEEVEILPPPRPFNYLFSMSTNLLKPPSSDDDSLDSSTCEGNNSYWYKKSTPIMNKYEIQIASS